MIRSYIKRIVREVLNSPAEGPQILRERPYNGPSTAEDALSNTAPSHMIFQIANGFVVVPRGCVDLARTISLPVFCKTGEEIAEAIIAGAVKERMNIGAAGSNQAMAKATGSY